ncbi:unnamed protein product [Bursaphelenchus xylophilus]|uniref:alpha-1,6-mannosyl-glycoprotein 6-beta-N-acetylglucosaminyltransferase n=1 Tax=Bursaphelenchus xylophilus TaxID=6326 RepID=A0A1I7RVE0_BURXY|nr:unnamed protein product [Bursaphelenchus xylophilus]CAG9086722.1 unnamed protein product [Bursaphelenchus xylophilus]
MLCYRKLRHSIYILLCVPVLLLVILYRKVDFNEKTQVEDDSIRLESFRLRQKSFCGRDIELIYNDTEYPECLQKLQWMTEKWSSDKCYAENGVDGSNCSVYNYISNVEKHCRTIGNNQITYQPTPLLPPKPLDIEDLMARMSDHPTNYDFIKRRIRELAPNWEKARQNLAAKRFVRPQKIFLYLGFLTVKKNNLAEAADKGGPLGELVQWSDLIASVATLGHNISVFGNWSRFKSALTELDQISACPKSTSEAPTVLIFIDIMGLRHIRMRLKTFYAQNLCRFRVLDSFGTHAEFNHPTYFRKNYKSLGAKSLKQNPWGGNGLNLKQFLTLYPHTDDNTFLGFVVQTFEQEDTKRENWTVIYGKEAYMWKDAGKVLQIASEFTQLHATVENATTAKEYANVPFENHGNLPAEKFHGLLRKAKVFLGLGFPIEGPAPLEAVANGAIYLNPIFKTAKSRRNYTFFAEKPTFRKITSQNFYMDRFVGRPYVINVDIEDEEDVRRAFKEAMNSSIEPTLSYEFTFLGMLERVSIIISKFDFCSPVRRDWPPFKEAGSVIEADAGQSCDEACASQGRLCESEFFKYINHPVELKRHGCSISTIESMAEPYSPSKCSLQRDPFLFSCATQPPAHVQRICPCRTLNRNQTILCATC